VDPSEAAAEAHLRAGLAADRAAAARKRRDELANSLGKESRASEESALQAVRRAFVALRSANAVHRHTADLLQQRARELRAAGLRREADDADKRSDEHRRLAREALVGRDLQLHR
jgi:hypothetical protein